MEKYDIKIFTNNIGVNASNQISLLLGHEAFTNSKIRIMPDVHVGKNCVVGFTATIKDKIIPNIIGVDIGCGMLCFDIGTIDIDYQRLDNFIKNYIPNGRGINQEVVAEFDLTKLLCYDVLQDIDFIKKSLGSLGGGNHFIEIDEDGKGNKMLVIHSGSRNLGMQVANFYQKLAAQTCKENIEPEYAYLEGNYRKAYLYDMKICQEYAQLNRYIIGKRIADYMGWKFDHYFESVHNYIDVENNIVRKGAISARKGEKVIIPINMRDGCIIGIGKGNPDWNYSAPHGAGRVMSREKALETINLDDYKKSMEGIYSTSIKQNTIDESPFVYKSIDEILSNINPTVDVEKIIKPVYNFKPAGKKRHVKNNETRNNNR